MKKIDEIIRVLRKTYPDARIALNFGNNFELLVAVILSAQCTDVRVNLVTPDLFRRFSNVRDYAVCSAEELEQLIYSTGFYRNKAKNIMGAAKMIVDEFDGEVPSEMDALLKLPGVARKTANVVLSAGFGKNEGVTVDTHVIRISGLLKLVPAKYVKVKNAVKIEQELMKMVPRKDWGIISHLLIFHGRKTCIARKPRCGECPLKKLCLSAKA